MTHVVGFWRDLLVDWADGRRVGFYPGRLSDVLDEGERRVPVVEVLGKLWNCTDTVPASVCVDLGFPTGSTYAQVVRTLKNAG